MVSNGGGDDTEDSAVRVFLLTTDAYFQTGVQSQGDKNPPQPHTPSSVG